MGSPSGEGNFSPFLNARYWLRTVASHKCGGDEVSEAMLDMRSSGEGRIPWELGRGVGPIAM